MVVQFVKIIFYCLLLVGKRVLVFSPSWISFIIPITSYEKISCFSHSPHSSILDHLRVQQLLTLALVVSELKTHLFWMP